MSFKSLILTLSLFSVSTAQAMSIIGKLECNSIRETDGLRLDCTNKEKQTEFTIRISDTKFSTRNEAALYCLLDQKTSTFLSLSQLSLLNYFGMVNFESTVEKQFERLYENIDGETHILGWTSGGHLLDPFAVETSYQSADVSFNITNLSKLNLSEKKLPAFCASNGDLVNEAL